MAEQKILTFKQYTDAKHRDAARRHEITIAEARRELPESIYRREWVEHVVSSYNAGADIPKRLWRSFDEDLQWKLRRSTRSLRGGDPANEYG